MMFKTDLPLLLVGLVALVAALVPTTSALGEEPGWFASLSTSAEQPLAKGGTPEFSLDGFVEVTRPSGAYGGLAFSKPFDSESSDEVDAYIGYRKEVTNSIALGLSYGLHVERDDKDCCGRIELSADVEGNSGGSVAAQLSFGLAGECCAAELSVELPVWKSARFASALSYDEGDGTYSANLSLTRSLGDAASASVTAGRDGSDRTLFIDIDLSYDIDQRHGIDVGLHDTDADSPSLSFGYTISLFPN